MSNTNVLVSVRNLEKIYKASNGKNIHALQGVSLDILSGEVLGLLGPNGAGKTTLASMIVTLFSPSAGEIIYNNASIFENLYEYRRIIGFCPQKPNLYTELTIEQNLFFSGRLYGLSDIESQSKTEELIKRYNLSKYKDHYIKDLSGGYKQRASIARSLIHSPKLILFDEPTVGLDPHIRRELWQEIKDLRASGVAIVLTTHYLDEAEFLSDRVCVLSHGKISFLDTPDNLKRDLNKNSLEDVMVDLFKDD